MGNNVYKVFSINDVDDAVFVMRALIAHVMNNLHYYKRYTDELWGLYYKGYARLTGLGEAFFSGISEEHLTRLAGIMSNPDVRRNYVSAESEFAIPGNLVHDIRDKLLFRQFELFKFMADEQNTSYSYKNLRKRLEKKGYLTEKLDAETTRNLQEMLIERNSTAHFTQSMMVAVKECHKNVYGASDPLQTQYNPLTAFIEGSFSIRFVGELAMYSHQMLSVYQGIFRSMQKDYKALYDQLPEDIRTKATVGEDYSTITFRCETTANDGRLAGDDNVRLSKLIQRNLYDGSPKSFEQVRK